MDDIVFVGCSITDAEESPSTAGGAAPRRIGISNAVFQRRFRSQPSGSWRLGPIAAVASTAVGRG